MDFRGCMLFKKLKRIKSNILSIRKQRRGQLSCYPVRMNIRIVVMGSAFVGKTAIIRRFITGSFPQRYVPTIEDMHRVTMNEVRHVLKI